MTTTASTTPDRIYNLLTRRDFDEMWAAVDQCLHAILPLDGNVADYPDAAHATIKRHRDRAFQVGHASQIAHRLTETIRHLEDNLRVLGFAIVATPEPPDHDTFTWT